MPWHSLFVPLWNSRGKQLMLFRIPDFSVQGVIFGHEPHLCYHCFNTAPSSLRLNCYYICCTAAGQTLMLPQLYSNLNAEEDDDETQDSKCPPMTGFAIVFNIFINGCVCHVGFHQYNINSTQNVVFFFMVVYCVSPWILWASCTTKWDDDGELCTCPWGVLPVGLIGFPKAVIWVLEFPQRDTAGICAACVASRLGQCIFFHLRKEKKATWSRPCEDEHRSDN